MSIFLCCFRKQPGEVHGEERELAGEARRGGPGGAGEGTEVLREGAGVR